MHWLSIRELAGETLVSVFRWIIRELNVLIADSIKCDCGKARRAATISFRAVWMVLAVLAAVRMRAADDSLTFHIRHWSSEDGLPANRVTALAQTRDGYLWVGTWFGLARFDGARFVVFNRANTPELTVEAISALAVDRLDGSLWIGTQSGLVRFKEGRFERVPGTNVMSRWDVSELAASESANGGVWVRASDRVGRYPMVRADDWAKLRFGHGSDRVAGMWETADGALELLVRQQIFRIERNGTFAEREVPTGWATRYGWTGSWRRDHLGRLWLANSRQLRRLTGDRWETIRTIPAREFPRERFLEDRTGAMWVAHDRVGLWRHVGDQQQEVRLGDRGADKTVDDLLEDREGHVWAATQDGLFQVRPRLFRTYSTEDKLPSAKCWSVCEAPDGAVWVDTDRGLARIHEGKVRTFPDEPERHHTAGVLVDLEQRVWMGRKHNGVMAWRPGSATNIFWGQPGPDAILHLDLTALYLGRGGRVWVGTSHGAVWFARGRPGAKFGELGLPTDSIRSIHETRDGAMWFGTFGAGAVRWVPGAGGAAGTRYGVADGLADDRVFAFHEDVDGAMWIGTHHGLSRFKGGRFFTFRTEHGLHDNLINWMEEDGFGRLWFSCNRGIYRMDRAELNAVADGLRGRARAVAYGATDGMLNPETNGERAPAGCKSQDGRIWFPTMDGVVVVDPALAQIAGTPPAVVIEEVIADGELIWANSSNEGYTGSRVGLAKTRPGLRERPIRLDPGRGQELQIRYTANTFLDPRRTAFQCRLVNLDADWRTETTERLAVYTNLRPGDYRFELRARNAHGVGSVALASFAFSLAPHFWQTWTFYALGGLAAIGVAAGVTAWRLRWQRRILRLEQVQALNSERTRIARDLHDELGSRLTALALSADMAGRDGQENARPLREFAAKSRELADRMRDVIWAVDPECDSMEALISRLTNDAEEFLGAAGVNLRLEISDSLPALPLSAEARHQLTMVAKEALHNAIKHARATEVRLALALDASVLQLRVSDNGAGFDPARPGEDGRGLANMRERVQGLKGVLNIDSRPGGGTTIEATVPRDRLRPRNPHPSP